MFRVGDWVLIGSGKKAHKLIQGYNSYTKRCTPNKHSLGFVNSADIEQEEMRDGASAEKCKRCIAK